MAAAKPGAVTQVTGGLLLEEDPFVLGYVTHDGPLLL